MAVAANHGNAKIHWGEAWSKTDFETINRPNMTYTLDDPLTAWRTEGVFTGGTAFNGARPRQATSISIQII
jgi:hypothetical protein